MTQMITCSCPQTQIHRLDPSRQADQSKSITNNQAQHAQRLLSSNTTLVSGELGQLVLCRTHFLTTDRWNSATKEAGAAWLCQQVASNMSPS